MSGLGRVLNSKPFVRLAFLLGLGGLTILFPSRPVQTDALTNTFIVTSRADSGAGSLRVALTQAQAGDTIRFDSGTFPPATPMTITLLSVLPTLSQGYITIDGSNAGVVLDGQYVSEYTDGLQVTSDGNVIKGLTIINFSGNGITVKNGARYNIIGGNFTVGSAPHGEGNILTANRDCGVVIEGSGTMSNTVSGNLIGLDVDGTRDWRVQALVVSPHYAADQTVWVGTRYHGVWRSTDGGTHWIDFSTGLTNLDVRNLVVSPDYITDHTLFAGMGGGAIFRSTNGGTSWTQVYTGAIEYNVSALAISPNFGHDGHVFAAIDGIGVLVSVDGGRTWATCNTGITDWVVHDIKVSPAYAVDKTVFVLSWRTVYKSVDAGASWQVLSHDAFVGGDLLAVSPHYAADQTLFLGVYTCNESAAFWKSTDGGTNWAPVGGNPGWCSLQSLAVAPDSGASLTLLVGDEWAGIFISQNAGASWSKVWEGRYTQAVAFSPAYSQDQIVFAGQKAGTVLKSVDGTNSWVEIAQAITTEPGNDDDGVRIREGAQYNVIGGPTTGARNVISHNGLRGILIAGAGTDYNQVLGNYIGTSPNGVEPLGNLSEGLMISEGAQHNTVGGTTASARNIVGGNGNTAVSLWGTGTMSNVVSGNYLGVNVSGTQALANDGSGINLNAGAQSNRVGGTTAGERNVLSGNRQNGLQISDSGTLSNIVVGNYVGVDAQGVVAIPNHDNGIVIGSGAQYNVIGGVSAGERNIVSGNRYNGIGIWETGTAHNTVMGNYIGLDATGVYSVGNGDWGVRLDSGAQYNRIGGVTPGEGNVISGNRYAGLGLTDSATMSNTVTGNLIGADATGSAPIGNEWGIACWNDSRYNVISHNLVVANSDNGIHLDGCSYNTMVSNFIGTNAAHATNLGNGGNGISLFNNSHHNMIGPGNVMAYNALRGVNIWDPATLYNKVSNNSIYANAERGIETGNGGNTELTPPVITAVTTNTIRGIAPLAYVVVEFFSDENDQGRLYEGHSLTDEAGFFVFTKPNGFVGPRLTATVTDNDGNTSEFSHPVNAVITPPPAAPGDVYEPDNNCLQARPIITTGIVQPHSFHAYADIDWITFNAVSGTTYLIQGQVPPDSAADLSAELYDSCNGTLLAEQDHTFAAGFSLEFTPAVDGPLYLHLAHHDPNVFGENVVYQLAVRALADEARPGAVIIVGGRLTYNDSLQNNIYYVASGVRQLFINHDYNDDRIMYLAADPTTPHADQVATAANLAQAITVWAVSRVDADRALTLYLVDHGVVDRFYLDKPNGEWITPAQLDGWLSQLEAAVPGVKINVIIEACHSGSFITAAETLSKPGRVIITSTDAANLARASAQGAVFSDYFLNMLAAGSSLYQSFNEARWMVQSAYPTQSAWLDDDGDGVFNEALDGQQAAQRGFNYAGTLSGDSWSPYIVQALGPEGLIFRNGALRAEVRDDIAVEKVWAEFYPPSYVPPEVEETWVVETVITQTLTAVTGDWYVGTYTGFEEPGIYRVVVHAQDVDGYAARPVAVEVQVGWRVHLPLVIRNR